MVEQARDQCMRYEVDEQCFGHISRGKDEYAVTAVLAVTPRPGDPSFAKRLLNSLVQRLANGDLMPVCPLVTTELFDVDQNNGPVHIGFLVPHRVPS
ncbi:hypothetical protein GCM10027436_16060 [Actinophytocola sediminis]